MEGALMKYQSQAVAMKKLHWESDIWGNIKKKQSKGIDHVNIGGGGSLLGKSKMKGRGLQWKKQQKVGMRGIIKVESSRRQSQSKNGILDYKYKSA